MKFISVTGLLALALVAAACAIAEGPREKLARSSFEFNEGLRWGRYNDVLPAVDAAAMSHFMDMHQGWGQDIRISSAEIIQTTYDEKAKKAVLHVQWVWYRNKEMVVYETVTVQNWEYRDGRRWMMAESHQSGQAF